MPSDYYDLDWSRRGGIPGMWSQALQNILPGIEYEGIWDWQRSMLIDYMMGSMHGLQHPSRLHGRTGDSMLKILGQILKFPSKEEKIKGRLEGVPKSKWREQIGEETLKSAEPSESIKGLYPLVKGYQGRYAGIGLPPTYLLSLMFPGTAPRIDPAKNPYTYGMTSGRGTPPGIEQKIWGDFAADLTQLAGASSSPGRSFDFPGWGQIPESSKQFASKLFEWYVKTNRMFNVRGGGERQGKGGFDALLGGILGRGVPYMAGNVFGLDPMASNWWDYGSSWF